MNNRRVKDIKSIYVGMPMLCCSCGKRVCEEQMWEISYFNYLDNRIDPYYCCYNCMPNKKDVIKAFGAEHLENDKITEDFNTTDFLKIFVAILKIKEYKSFNYIILTDFIHQKINDNEYNRILKVYNTKNLLESLKTLIKEEYVYTNMSDNSLKVLINSKKEVTPLLINRLEYLEEMLSFTEKYKFVEKIENYKTKYNDKDNNKHKTKS